MRKKTIAVLFWLSFMLVFLSKDSTGAENFCVTCHKGIPKDTFIGSKSLDWEGSLHAKEGVTCDRCHGGNPGAERKESAHTGVLNSGNPRSRVYYKNVPDTCGACHRRDFNEFKKSTHSAFLERIGAGPTCVTCHGSHTSRIISPQQIPSVCERCHTERMRINPHVPTLAQAVLLLMNETTVLLRYAKNQIPESDPQAMQAWKDAQAAMEKARDDWHAFDLEQVQRKILAAYETIARFLVK